MNFRETLKVSNSISNFPLTFYILFLLQYFTFKNPWTHDYWRISKETLFVTYLIIFFTGFIVPQALEANPKQTRIVLSSNFRSKSNRSIVQLSWLNPRDLTSMLRFSANRAQGETFASWQRSETIMLTLGNVGRLLMWSSIDLAIWKVRVVILGPKVTYKERQCCQLF